MQHAVVCFHPTDERVLFALPVGRPHVHRHDRYRLRATRRTYATLEDVDYPIDASNALQPHQIARADVIGPAGLRPLVAPPQKAGMSESDVSREHEILVGRDGLLTIAGGKLTTYRRMAGEVVDTAVKLLRLQGDRRTLTPSRTDENPLPGGQGWPENDDHAEVGKRVRAASEDRLDEDVALHLANTYGMRALAVAKLVKEDPGLGHRLVPDRPEILAQVTYAATHELAASVCDVMVRRTQLFYRDVDQGLGCVEAVAHELGRRLGWDDKTQRRSADAYRAEVALSRRWREETR
ncbi:MAG: glycerol-3-phosphate dehydrogenase C-terminal domain-containing protein [Polyangiales bacterium]